MEFFTVLAMIFVSASAQVINIDNPANPPPGGSNGNIEIVPIAPANPIQTDNSGGGSTSGGGSATATTASNVTNLGADGKVQFAPSGGTIVMNPGNAFIVSSSRSQRSLISGIARMRTWDFVANQCRLGAMCPCINLPPSYNCLSSYVKIRTGIFSDLQKFCGGNKPNQAVQSDTGELSILFKPDGSGITNSLFKCIVTCTAPSSTITLPDGTTTCP